MSPVCPNCGEEMIPPSSLLNALRTRAIWNCPRCWFEILKETEKVKADAARHAVAG